MIEETIDAGELVSINFLVSSPVEYVRKDIGFWKIIVNSRGLNKEDPSIASTISVLIQVVQQAKGDKYSMISLANAFL